MATKVQKIQRGKVEILHQKILFDQIATSKM